jgi:hypothetical protein
MKKWWHLLMNDEAYFRTFTARVSRFALAVGAALLASWAGAPEWVQVAAGASGLLVGAGEKNPLPKEQN